jgi:hypothetical protein
VALDIGGFEQRSDWPKMGPSPFIGTCLILTIRTAKWPATFNERCREMDLDREIAYAAQLAGRVLAALVGRQDSENQKTNYRNTARFFIEVPPL